MKIKPFFISVFLSLVTLLSLNGTVSAQDSGFLPKFFTDIFKNDPIGFAADRVRVFFVLMIGAFLLIVIFYIIKGLMDFSRDEAKEIGDAGKIMQKQFIAVAGVFIAVIGVAVILVYFGASLFQIIPSKICLDNPSSYGCFACTNQKTGSLYANICEVCNGKVDRDIKRDPDGTFVCNATAEENGKTMTDKEIKDILDTANKDALENLM